MGLESSTERSFSECDVTYALIQGALFERSKVAKLVQSLQLLCHTLALASVC